ncbi:MAG: 5-dehydro-2-deoxygluconokinase [Bauldia sp.]|uniref:bifunctional 5-dehydro-2-deoxygluconokinase/5-dehydro-2- deoxyphosphogluconate aldolase n=1 Tax=Bauldia sp. TaxID=2575872 RepID=UPI001DDF2F0C|nr:5-dehydro-2-deoxygluconokinase [Bauldia sp.]MCB1495733.1 5-dehydro-2-deoxygluconokinase [Bauldia sp.]
MPESGRGSGPESWPEPTLDVVTVGRSSVDLYGKQIGSRLEDVSSFAKSVGGCPANIAIGAARLGLRSALVTGVGDEQMGRFIREQLVREGVVVDGVKIDRDRLSALVLLSVENDSSFPLLFVRENCADMALSEDDIDPELIRSAKALVVTGTHFSQDNVAAAQFRAMEIARAAGRRVVFDIDYRPNLWGLAGHAAGDERFIASDSVSAHLQTVLPHCDLIVGTEEEVRIAGGGDVLSALRTVRSLSDATIVLKRGPMGCVVYAGAIPDDLDTGIVGRGFPIEVHNVLGAGDAFMAGFLRGWLRDEPIETAATWANACGAFAVSRLLCSPEYPTWQELNWFLEHGSEHHALRHDPMLNHIHWATTRRPRRETLMALAIDHRAQLEAVADRLGAPRERISAFKSLAVAATAQVADGRPGFGILLDETYGRDAMADAASHPLWVGRPVEQPGSRPLRFEFTQDIGGRLAEWPVTHTVKCLAFMSPDDDAALMTEQIETLRTLYDAARTNQLELLVEVISSKQAPLAGDTTASILSAIYAAGIKPDWWKLEAQPTSDAWAAIETVIAGADPWCRGIVLLGLEAPAAALREAFARAADFNIVKGFAVGRTIFSDCAEKWLAGTIGDEAAIATMAAGFNDLVATWQQLRDSQTA